MMLATRHYIAAMEENLYFENVDATRADKPYNYTSANPVNTKLSKAPGKNEGFDADKDRVETQDALKC